MPRPAERSVVMAALISVLLWSSAFVAIRFVGRELGPGPVALARLAVGSIALGAVMLARRERPPSGRSVLFAALSGLLWFAIYNFALNAAERRIDAGTASLLVNTGPIFLALLAGLVLREGYPRALMVGCTVSFAGAALIAVGVSHQGLEATWGAALCLLAAIVYAGGVVAQKPALAEASALSVTWLACTVATVVCLPFAPQLVNQLGRASGATIGWTIYLGIGPLAIGFGTWAYALARTHAGRLGVATYLVPPLVVLLSWLFLGQAPPLLALPGGLLCLLGVGLARRRAVAGGTVQPPAARTASPSGSESVRVGRPGAVPET